MPISEDIFGIILREKRRMYAEEKENIVAANELSTVNLHSELGSAIQNSAQIGAASALSVFFIKYL